MLEENVALDATDKINIIKDGQSSKETYYGHIHTLFSLYQLSETQQDVMRCLCLIPLTGIPARRFAAWLNLPDLNAVNDLIEMGFIQPKTGRTIVLHPMIQEIAVADMQPSVKNLFPFTGKSAKSSAFYTAMIFPTTDLFSKPLKTLLQKQLKMIFLVIYYS